MIRVRAEADQFLLSCHTIETFVRWLQSLFAAIDLAPPLDDRDLPRDLSIPRPRRRRGAMAVERDIYFLREEQEALARQYPRLVETAIPEEPSPADEAPTSDAVSAPISIPIRQRNSMIPLVMGVCTSAAPTPNRPDPSISSSSGKWAPPPPSSPWTEMQYAKRCMGVLTSRTPRKSNLVIMKGKQWVVDWPTGKLTKWVPPPAEALPQYGELGSEKIVAESEREETWIVGHYENLVRA